MSHRVFAAIRVLPVAIAVVWLAPILVVGQAPKASPLAQAPATPAPAPQPVGTLSELMVKILYPTSDAIFYISTRVPENEVEWNELQAKALTLAESANLLMMPDRAKDQTRWMEDSKLLLDVGLAAFEAAKKKDVEGLSALNDPLYKACVTCHQHYRPNYRRRPQPQ